MKTLGAFEETTFVDFCQKNRYKIRFIWWLQSLWYKYVFYGKDTRYKDVYYRMVIKVKCQIMQKYFNDIGSKLIYHSLNHPVINHEQIIW